MMKKTKGVHKALGRGGRVRVTEITIKSRPVRVPAANQRRQEVKGK
jgi:hypothetical protein